MENPGVIGIGDWRHDGKVRTNKSLVVSQFVSFALVFQIERRICHDIINFPINQLSLWLQLNQFGNEFDDTSERVKFAVFFSSRRGISLQKIFVNAPDKIFFVKKFFVNPIDVIYKIFYPRFFRAECGKDSVHSEFQIYLQQINNSGMFFSVLPIPQNIFKGKKIYILYSCHLFTSIIVKRRLFCYNNSAESFLRSQGRRPNIFRYINS